MSRMGHKLTLSFRSGQILGSIKTVMVNSPFLNTDCELFTDGVSPPSDGLLQEEIQRLHKGRSHGLRCQDSSVSSLLSNPSTHGDTGGTETHHGLSAGTHQLPSLSPTKGLTLFPKTPRLFHHSSRTSLS